MTEQLDDFQAATANKRPTFLTVLCILTFIVSGIMTLVELFGIGTAIFMDQTGIDEAIIEMEDSMNDVPMEDMPSWFESIFDSSMELAGVEAANALSLAIIGFLAAALSLLGAIIMFNQKKKGYYLYIASKIIGILGPLIIYGFSGVALFIMGFPLFWAALFIVLYGLNLKHMR